MISMPDLNQVAPEDNICSRLDFLCRQRKQIMQARMRLGNQISALERQVSGETKGKKVAKNYHVSEMARLTAMIMAPMLTEFATQMEKVETPYDKEIEKYAKRLPVATWVKQQRGAGLKMLGLIIGETGDLNNYSNPAKVWKRMGLAVMADGQRQRRVKGEEAILHGYDARRRSVMYLLGDCLIKGNKDGVYRKLYDTRKEYELTRLPEDAKGRQGWAHARASRYMQKRFLVDLWKAWRECLTGVDSQFVGAPVSPSTEQTEAA